MNTKAIFTSINGVLKKHGPKILTGLGVGGFVTTVILAVKATPEAHERLKKLRENEYDHKLTLKQTVGETWKLYVPAASAGVLSIGCVIGGAALANHQTAVLASACAITETAFKEYRAQTKEVVGKDKEEEIVAKIAEKHLKDNPIESREVVMRQNHDTLCFDAFSGRYFMSDMQELKSIENRLNRRLLDDMIVSLNDYYDELDLSHIKVGDEMGWNIKEGLMDFKFSSILAEDGRPCLVVDAYLSPDIDYKERW